MTDYTRLMLQFDREVERECDYCKGSGHIAYVPSVVGSGSV